MFTVLAIAVFLNNPRSLSHRKNASERKFYDFGLSYTKVPRYYRSWERKFHLCKFYEEEEEDSA